MKPTRSTCLGVALLGAPTLLLLIFLEVESHLLASGFLNKRDLGFVGGESGTPGEYLANVWHWDALGVVLMLGVPMGFLAGVVVLWKERNAHARQGGSGPDAPEAPSPGRAEAVREEDCDGDEDSGGD